jgi:uncharacterized BrkB/YihY/UPF0761 family membrane protein
MSKRETEKKTEMALEKQNYLLLAIAFIFVIIGFFLMMGGKSENPEVFNDGIYNFRRITLAPIVVLFGFLFGIYSIMKKPSATKKDEKKS